MPTNDQIRYRKLQHDINRHAARISALPTSKTDKYEYLTHEKMLPPDQSRPVEKLSLLVLL